MDETIESSTGGKNKAVSRPISLYQDQIDWCERFCENAHVGISWMVQRLINREREEGWLARELADGHRKNLENLRK